MDLIFKIFLTMHIIGGSLGLISGTINIIRKKGDKNHKLVGKIFAISMLVAGFSAFILSILHPNYFLFMVGIFTVYMVGTGYRFIYLKLLGSTQKPGIIDWVMTVAMFVIAILLIGFGGYLLMKANNFGVVFIVFGVISVLFVKKDVNHFQGIIKEKNYWLLIHLQRMIGAYIASSTAFIVVNAQYFPTFIPSIVFWLLPTIVLTPLIISWSKKYRIE